MGSDVGRLLVGPAVPGRGGRGLVAGARGRAGQVRALRTQRFRRGNTDGMEWTARTSAIVLSSVRLPDRCPASPVARPEGSGERAGEHGRNAEGLESSNDIVKDRLGAHGRSIGQRSKPCNSRTHSRIWRSDVQSGCRCRSPARYKSRAAVFISAAILRRRCPDITR